MRIGAHQKELLAYLYDNWRFSREKSATLDEFDKDLIPIDLIASGLKYEVWGPMLDHQKNLYFTLWSGIRLLKKMGLVSTSERHYHEYRKIWLTEGGIRWLESRRKDIIGKTWAERATERCHGCPNWSTSRMDSNSVLLEGLEEGCFYNYDIRKWDCEWLRRYGNMNPDLTSLSYK